MLWGVLIDVIGTEDVSKENALELSTLEQLGQFCPILEISILMGVIPRMGPETRGLMPSAVHRESIKFNLSGHLQGNAIRLAQRDRKKGSRNSAKGLVGESFADKVAFVWDPALLCKH